MTDLSTMNRAARAMDERDTNILRDVRAKLKTVADNYDVEAEKVWAIAFGSMDRQTIMYLLGENT